MLIFIVLRNQEFILHCSAGDKIVFTINELNIVILIGILIDKINSVMQ